MFLSFQKILPKLYEWSAQLSLLTGNKRKFMNLGYEPALAEIHSEDLADAHHISLYLTLLQRIPSLQSNPQNLKALEIGCGRGGGCYTMQKYLGLQKITGLDLSPGNIRLAQKNVKQVNFRQANAATFQTDELYDLVVNLESSHAYPSRAEFFRRVAISLKPGGYFAFGDLIRKTVLDNTEKALEEAGFSILQAETINENVIRSVEKNSRKHHPLPSRFPFLFPKKYHSFTFTVHSRAFRVLQEREVLYRLYLLQKK